MATPDQLVGYLAPAASAIGTVLYWALYLSLILGIIYWVVTYFTFNVKVMLRENTKGGRTIVRIVRAKKVHKKEMNHPVIQFYGMLGFGGRQINQPPTECIFPYKSMMGNTTLYDFVVKDGLYFPVTNTVIGRKYVLLPNEQSKDVDEDLIKQIKSYGFEVKREDSDGSIIYSTEGSGLEVTRDFDAEQSTLNDLIAAAEKYKNRKPIEIAAMYGLMIVMVVGSFVVLFYAFYKTGQIGEAVNRGWGLFEELGTLIIEDKLGPG